MKKINIPSFNVLQFQQKLINWYQENHRQLPWRGVRNPYYIWVSEVMLQQTQVVTVLPYFRRFIERFPTLSHLATADEQSVLKAWEGLGYYARARNLHRAARRVMEKFDGEIPADYHTFLKLPGVGKYIAAAVMSLAFNQPIAVVDGNVKRVLARLFLLEDPVNESRSYPVFEGIATQLLDKEEPGLFNQALMELGALVCRPQNPACSICQIANFCQAKTKGKQTEYPRRSRKKAIPEYRIAVGVIEKEGRLLITRRRNDGLLGGLWEFPGGKVQPGETPENACQREIAEEVNLQVCVIRKLARVRHAYTHFKIEMDVFLCRYTGGEVQLNGAVDYRWIYPEEIENYPFPGANRKFFPQLLVEFNQ